MLSKISTEELLRELYDRMDDNLYAPERRDDEYLDSIDKIEKQALKLKDKIIDRSHKAKKASEVAPVLTGNE